MTNIAFIVHTASGGGAERAACVLASEFASRRGYSVSLIAFFPVEGEYRLSQMVSRSFLFESMEAYRVASKAERLSRLRMCIKNTGVEYVIPFLWYVCLYAQVALVGTGARVIATVRNNPAIVPASAAKRAIRNVSLLLAWKGFTQTEEQRAYFNPIVRQKLRVVPNPVSSEFIDVEADPSISENVVMIGRLEPQKGHTTMVEACRLLAEKGIRPKVRIYGEGGSRAFIQEAIDRNGLTGTCTLEGRTDDVSSVLENAGIYVLASSYEGMPNSLMEAMAAGIPCISTDCPTGPSELIVSGNNGYLIEVGDAGALAGRIEQLLADPSLRRELGTAAKKSISERFSPSRIADVIERDLLDIEVPEFSSSLRGRDRR